MVVMNLSTRRNRGRILALGMLLVSLALGTVASIVIYYNVGYSAERIRMSSGSQKGIDDGLDQERDRSRPAWVQPLLKDLSLVSPGLVASTALFMAWGAFLVIRLPAPTARLAAHRFPFPGRYKIYYINMGLLGTIIGFVIAFSDIDLKAEDQSMVLLDALGTALWSTLTAISLAYIFCPLIEVAYNRLGRLRFGSLPQPDFPSQLEELKSRADATIGAFEGLTGSVRSLTGELDRQSWVRLSEVEGRIAALVDRVAPLEQRVESLSDKADGLSKTVKQNRAESADRSRGIEKRIGAMESRIEDLFRGFRKALG